jgi:hypothetical protein
MHRQQDILYQILDIGVLKKRAAPADHPADASRKLLHERHVRLGIAGLCGSHQGREVRVEVVVIQSRHLSRYTQRNLFDATFELSLRVRKRSGAMLACLRFLWRNT